MQALEDSVDVDRGQPDRGLVEDQQPRLQQQRAGDGQHLLLAAAQRARPLASTLAQHREQLDRGVDAAAALGGRQRPPPPEQRKIEVVLDAEIGEQAAALRHGRDARPGAAGGRPPIDRLPVELDRAGEHAHEAGHGSGQRGLAGSVGPDHRDHPTRRDLEIDVVQDRRLAVARGEPAHGEHRRGHATAAAAPQ
ncbi:MAG: hypothetical protein U0S48_08880 [Solirubrobacteraceae bacterium]